MIGIKQTDIRELLGQLIVEGRRIRTTECPYDENADSCDPCSTGLKHNYRECPYFKSSKLRNGLSVGAQR